MFYCSGPSSHFKKAFMLAMTNGWPAKVPMTSLWSQIIHIITSCVYDMTDKYWQYMLERVSQSVWEKLSLRHNWPELPSWHRLEPSNLSVRRPHLKPMLQRHATNAGLHEDYTRMTRVTESSESNCHVKKFYKQHKRVLFKPQEFQAPGQ